MPRINLLPHRESKRKERKLKFLVALGAAAVAAGITAFAAYLMYGQMIDAQQHRNSVLRAQIKTLDKENEEINNLETAKQKYIARMEIIEKLQRSRPEIVHVFDEIVKTVPDGIYLTGIKQTEQKFKFDGEAQSATRVSAFMRNIDSSEWLTKPELQGIAAEGSGGNSSFTVFADEVTSAADSTPAPAPSPRTGAKNGGVRRGVAP
jgi:type IV pilus assembly protein PilN